MVDREKEILNFFHNYSFISNGEVYIQLSQLSKFVDLCMANNAVIFSIELFRVMDGNVIPYAELLGFDSSQMFNENEEWKINLKKCNEFILKCYESLGDKLSNLYFSAVIDFQKK